MAAVQKIDTIFAAERAIIGRSADERLAARRTDVAPLVEELLAWMTEIRMEYSATIWMRTARPQDESRWP
jgi:hypothetical protein